MVLPSEPSAHLGGGRVRPPPKHTEVRLRCHNVTKAPAPSKVGFPTVFPDSILFGGDLLISLESDSGKWTTLLRTQVTAIRETFLALPACSSVFCTV